MVAQGLCHLEQKDRKKAKCNPKVYNMLLLRRVAGVTNKAIIVNFS